MRTAWFVRSERCPRPIRQYSQASAADAACNGIRQPVLVQRCEGGAPGCETEFVGEAMAGGVHVRRIRASLKIPPDWTRMGARHGLEFLIL